MPNSGKKRSETTPKKTRRRSRVRRILLGLGIVLAVLLLAMAVLLYNPVRTLATLEKVDDFPLYVMHYKGTYLFDVFAEEGIEWGPYQEVYHTVNPDACTSFAALDRNGDAVFGRNFDWNHRSSLLLFTDPPGGYASVSMVDLYYLGFEGMQEIPWSKRLALLATPYAAIDGMNECGVAIAQNAVPERNTPKDPNKPTLLNSQIVRLVLDHAKDVEEGLALIQQYNVEFAALPVHFHLADASGASAIVEYLDDGIHIVREDTPWQVSTNYLFSEEVQPECWRYDKAVEILSGSEGIASNEAAMRLLEAVKQDHTVWSVVYGLDSGSINVAMVQDYEDIRALQLHGRNHP
ncbi:MAG: linear amide C-N hydrolase [Sedimentisphaerales bacterium]|nr:linear amide C-N hydrolase [Sedimentisphaerales bacterium]